MADGWAAFIEMGRGDFHHDIDVLSSRPTLRKLSFVLFING